MGKYYSRIGGNLYIYVTRGDSLIDLKYFPNELNLFTAESAWRIKDKMAIVNTGPAKSRRGRGASNRRGKGHSPQTPSRETRDIR